jgi:solute carrier family 31 (copper transporter), member 1
MDGNMAMGAFDAIASEGSNSIANKCSKNSVMLWNWNTVDICLISSNWHIRSTTMFAGSCIAVLLLAMSLALLRRLSKEYDTHMKKNHEKHMGIMQRASVSRESSNSNTFTTLKPGKTNVTSKAIGFSLKSGRNTHRFRPSLVQQLLRGFLQLSQVAVAYFTMLIFMLLNGYLIFSILGGIFLGYVVFEWESVECT